jgi:hypothetical protein
MIYTDEELIKMFEDIEYIREEYIRDMKDIIEELKQLPTRKMGSESSV